MDACALRKLASEIESVDQDVHDDILRFLKPHQMTVNDNGVFFDLGKLESQQVEGIAEVVRYVRTTSESQGKRDKELFESSKQLASNTFLIHSDSQNVKADARERISDGEDAFCQKMESGCVAKSAKGVFIKRTPI
jgi:uncharacterized protein (DUF2235 family)